MKRVNITQKQIKSGIWASIASQLVKKKQLATSNNRTCNLMILSIPLSVTESTRIPPRTITVSKLPLLVIIDVAKRKIHDLSQLYQKKYITKKKKEKPVNLCSTTTYY